jgi:hypothetical protein
MAYWLRYPFFLSSGSFTTFVFVSELMLLLWIFYLYFRRTFVYPFLFSFSDLLSDVLFFTNSSKPHAMSLRVATRSPSPPPPPFPPVYKQEAKTVNRKQAGVYSGQNIWREGSSHSFSVGSWSGAAGVFLIHHLSAEWRCGRFSVTDIIVLINDKRGVRGGSLFCGFHSLLKKVKETGKTIKRDDKLSCSFSHYLISWSFPT